MWIWGVVEEREDRDRSGVRQQQHLCLSRASFKVSGPGARQVQWMDSLCESDGHMAYAIPQGLAHSNTEELAVESSPIHWV